MVIATRSEERAQRSADRTPLLEAVRAQIAREEATMTAIREGRYQGSYGKS